MKTTKTYLSGCTWCGAKGFVKNYNSGYTNVDLICPVCHGSKTVLVTEVTEDEPVKP